MFREQFHIGQRVLFGRRNGAKTLGEIVKLNEKKAKVKTLEDRGIRSQAGVEWGGPYSMMTPADDKGESAKPTPVVYNPLKGEDNVLMDFILSCYSHLSPENLTMDGEASRAQITQRRAELERRLKGYQLALGRIVTEEEAYQWLESKQAYQKQHSR